MALRMILLGLVASLGLEPPTMSSLEVWGRSGREWVSARTGDLVAITTGPIAVDEVPPSVDTPAPVAAAAAAIAEPSAPVVEVAAAPTAAVDDLTFEVVVEGMAVRFADDLAMRPTPPEATIVAAPPVVEEDTEMEAPTPVAVAAVPDSSAVLVTAEPVAATRFSNALTLTRQAVAAWASLIDAPRDQVAASRDLLR